MPRFIYFLCLLLLLRLPVLADADSVDLCLEAIQPPQGLQVGQTGQVVIRLLNKGTTVISAAKVVLSADGQKVGEAKLAEPLSPSSRVDLSLPWSPKEPGKHVLTAVAETSAPDLDPRNNRRECSVALGEKVQGADVRLITLETRDGDLFRGLPANVTVGVDNTGDAPLHRLNITLFEDQKKIASKAFYTRLPGHSQREYVLSWIPKQTGSHELTAVMGLFEEMPARPGIVVRQRVTVVERMGHKLEITSVQAPTPARVEQESTTEVVVRNAGELDARDVKVTLLLDGARLNSQRVEEVKAGQECHFSLTWTPHKAGTMSLTFVVEAQGRVRDRNKSAALKLERKAVVEVRP